MSQRTGPGGRRPSTQRVLCAECVQELSLAAAVRCAECGRLVHAHGCERGGTCDRCRGERRHGELVNAAGQRVRFGGIHG